MPVEVIRVFKICQKGGIKTPMTYFVSTIVSFVASTGVSAPPRNKSRPFGPKGTYSALAFKLVP